MEKQKRFSLFRRIREQKTTSQEDLVEKMAAERALRLAVTRYTWGREHKEDAYLDDLIRK